MLTFLKGFPGGSDGKESTYNARVPDSIPGSGRSPGEGDRLPTPVFMGFPSDSAAKEITCNVQDLGFIPELGRSRTTYILIKKNLRICKQN